MFVVDFAEQVYSFHKTPLIKSVIFNVALKVRFVPQLQFPREIEVGFVLEIHMQASIFWLIAKIPIL